MKKQCLDWAIQYRNWTAIDRSKVLFSDESHFEGHNMLGEVKGSQVISNKDQRPKHILGLLLC